MCWSCGIAYVQVRYRRSELLTSYRREFANIKRRKACRVQLCLSSKEFDRIDIENTGKFLQHVDRSCVLLSFEHADIVAIDVRAIRKFLLGQAFGLPYPAKVLGDGLPQAHAREVTGSLIYRYLVY